MIYQRSSKFILKTDKITPGWPQVGRFAASDGVVKGDSLWFTANINTMKIKNKLRYYGDGDSMSLRVGMHETD